MMAVNVKGAFLCCQVFGGAMAAAGAGSIVNIGSIYGILSPDQGLYQYRRDRGETFFKPVAYSVSKSALMNLTRYLAVYWGRAGVRVNTLVFAGVAAGQDAEFLKAYLPKVPLGRMAEPADYDGPVVFLMSDASRYMTGSTMVVDGGFSAM
jgi:NAD(P)-dependent dehydrogenase (short-subunit alcohol dehydrogenase family)